MKTATRLSLATLALVATSLAPVAALADNSASSANADTTANAAQQQFGALERGYRTGYSDGYQSGYGDSVNSRPRDYRSKEDYQRADRVYLPAYGSLEDYRDGYQQGFEIGYSAGFERQGFDSSVPAMLRRRGTTTTNSGSAPRNTGGPPVIRRDDDNNQRDTGTTTNDPASASNIPATNAGGMVEIPGDTRLRIELLNNISTDVSQRGDHFEARVVDPAQFTDAVVTGHIASVRRPGKVRGSGELQLSFDEIRLADGRRANLSAQVTEVVQTRTDSDTGTVDPEGGVHGRSTTKDDVTKVGAASGIGAVIGAIAGGGKGAAIGAILGAGVGTGGVMTSRGRDIRLERGQQLMIRTSADTRVQ